MLYHTRTAAFTVRQSNKDELFNHETKLLTPLTRTLHKNLSEGFSEVFLGFSSQVNQLVVLVCFVDVSQPTSPACLASGQNLTDPSGSFASPNFPNNYEDNSACKWRLVATLATEVSVVCYCAPKTHGSHAL